jgi:hypothetical protein
MALGRKAAGVVSLISAVAGAAASGRLGVIILGSIAGTIVGLACLLALVAVFGAPERQIRAERVLQIILPWAEPDSCGAGTGEPSLTAADPDPPLKVPVPEAVQGTTESALVPIALGATQDGSTTLRGISRPAVSVTRRRRPARPG